MNFDPTEEQQALVERVIEFAQRELNDDVVNRDAQQTFPHDAWKKCGEFGIQGMPVPTEYGGSGADAQTLIFAMEALGYACRDNGLLFALNAHMWACEYPIAKYGSEKQKQRYLAGLSDGSLVGAHAASEVGAGSDAASLETTAAPAGDGFVLSGSKTFVTNGPIADVFLVFAATEGSSGFGGLSAFLVERDAVGLTAGPALSKMGLRTALMGEVFFEDCAVPADSVLGKPGAGLAIFNWTMERERSLILATALGTMTRSLERSLDYARQRKQFGQPIGKFQAVSHRIVDMKLRLETARLLLYRLGWLMDTGRRSALESSLSKMYLSECFVQSSLDALQIHGGYGYLSDYEVERDVRDALASRIYSGTSEIQKNLVARYMGL